MRLRARWYATGELRDFVNDGRVWTVGPPDPAKPPDREAGWVAPALFDLQINGCDGRSFNSPQLTIDDVRHVVDVCRRHGIAGLCPTLVTQSAEALLHGFAVLRRACETDADDRPGRAGAAPGGAVHQPRGRPARRPPAAPRPPARLGRVPPLPGRGRRPHSPGDAGPGTRRRPGVHREADRRPAWSSRSATRPRRGRASATPCGPAPGCPRTSATARTPCCRGTTTTSGSNWPPTSCGPASSATAIICRRPWCAASCASRRRRGRADLRRQQPGRPAAGPLPRSGARNSRYCRAARWSFRGRATWPGRACSPTPASAGRCGTPA